MFECTSCHTQRNAIGMANHLNVCDGSFIAVVDATSVECPECEAGPGEHCITWWYGQEYPAETHQARQEAADVASEPS